MSYVPSTKAQNAAVQAGNNQASLASPVTALQTAIADGLLAPAAFIDGILMEGTSYQTVELNGSAKPQEAILNFSSNFTATDTPGSSRTDIGLSTATLIAPQFTGTSTDVPSVSWSSVSYQNSWADAGSPYLTQYYKDVFGVVHFQIAASHAGATTATLFTFPAGYRPNHQLYYTVVDGSGSPTFFPLVVATNGNVSIGGSSGQTSVYTGELIFTAAG